MNEAILAGASAAVVAGAALVWWATARNDRQGPTPAAVPARVRRRR